MADQFTQQAVSSPVSSGELKLVYDLSGRQLHAWFRWTHVVQAVTLLLRSLRSSAAGMARRRVSAFGIAGCSARIPSPAGPRGVSDQHVPDAADPLLRRRGRRAVAPSRGTTARRAALRRCRADGGVRPARLGHRHRAAMLGARGVSRPGSPRWCSCSAAILGALRRAGYRIARPSRAQFGLWLQDARPPSWWSASLESVALLPVQHRCVDPDRLFSEPTGGVLSAHAGLPSGDVRAPMIVRVVASLGARRAVRLRLEAPPPLDRAAVDMTIGSCFSRHGAHRHAVISYPYLKDTKVTPAGAFFAVAVFAAARHSTPFCRRACRPRPRRSIAALTSASPRVGAARRAPAYAAASCGRRRAPRLAVTRAASRTGR